MRVHTDWLLTPYRAAVHVPTATAVVADLHLGYSQARRHGGEAVPLPDLGDLLSPLKKIAARRLVIAGDLFEAGASSEMIEGLLGWLQTAGLELAGVVPGNHDRRLLEHAGTLPVCPDGITLGAWQVVHGDGTLPKGAVVHGHVHPCLRWGRNHSAPCYLVGADRLVLPAFSGDAAGVNVLGKAAWRSCRCLVPVGEEVLDFGELATREGSGRKGRGVF